MSDLVRNPEDRFSRDAAQIIADADNLWFKQWPGTRSPALETKMGNNQNYKYKKYKAIKPNAALFQKVATQLPKPI